MKSILLLLVPVSLLLGSCWGFTSNRPPKPEPPPKKVLGYKPVYSTDAELLKVKSEGARAMKNPGKIYVRGNLIFQNDQGYGIHVIDNSDPASAHAIGFIRIYGNSEISIQGNYLYANFFSDIVVADISDWQNVTEVKRIRQAFDYGSSVQNVNYVHIPVPEKGVYYECQSLYSNKDKVQTGWIKDSIYDYNCYNQ